MTSSSSSEEDFVIACAVAEDEEDMNRKRKHWNHNINLKREIYGEFHHLHGYFSKIKNNFSVL